MLRSRLMSFQKPIIQSQTSLVKKAMLLYGTFNANGWRSFKYERVTKVEKVVDTKQD